MANVIKFDCNYPKLCNQAKAKLVWFSIISKYYFGKDNDFTEDKLEIFSIEPA